MKKSMIVFVFMAFYVTVSAQITVKENRLQRTLREIHKALSVVNTEFEPNLQYYWNNSVYLEKNGILQLVSIDSLNKLNYLEYDIKVVFDETNIPRLQYLTGVIVISPLSKKRKYKLIDFFQKEKKKEKKALGM